MGMAMDNSGAPMSGILGVASDTTQDMLVLPWSGSDQVQGFAILQKGLGSVESSGFQTQGSTDQGPVTGIWTASYPPVTFPVPLGLTPRVNIWPYPSVPDTGYYSVLLKALPFREYTLVDTGNQREDMERLLCRCS